MATKSCKLYGFTVSKRVDVGIFEKLSKSANVFSQKLLAKIKNSLKMTTNQHRITTLFYQHIHINNSHLIKKLLAKSEAFQEKPTAEEKKEQIGTKD